ncbi:glycosyltransferase family 2 protein [Emticicia sp. C21]|uniref:glycosyltransferase family 2 protein n=1 Tax=Emticicia sp. C21 TaxID=2302915 RepID=UPI000E355CA9|nr:glycosyltransferase family A protein [Emticicia sp. C21]RFS17536.1 glycosyltransferase family 2 protein [Emticicia sp. C21]
MSVYISVVIPTYRRPELLSRCLAALQRQTFPATYYEVIVVGDGVDFPSRNIVHTLQKKISHFHYYELKKKKGPAAARNYGWKQATGKLIAFTDDDCIPSVDWLQAFWDSYQSYNKANICMSGRLIVPIPKLPTDYEKNVSLLETADFITANCACTKVALRMVNGFDEDFPIAWREDSALEFAMRSFNIPVVKSEDAVVLHPVRKAFWGISLKEQKKTLYDVLLHKKYPVFFPNNKINWLYYAIVISSVTAIIALIVHKPVTGFIASGIWLLLIVGFVIRRLHKTILSFSHVTEMITTSVLIPYLSIYWTLRGALRYKVFYL